MSQTATTYRVSLTRPSRSKCPNAWAKIEGADGWLADQTILPHGTEIILGGSIRRATRIEQYRAAATIDEAGSWPAWAGTGRLTIEAV